MPTWFGPWFSIAVGVGVLAFRKQVLEQIRQAHGRAAATPADLALEHALVAGVGIGSVAMGIARLFDLPGFPIVLASFVLTAVLVLVAFLRTRRRLE